MHKTRSHTTETPRTLSMSISRLAYNRFHVFRAFADQALFPQECQSLESGEPHDVEKSGVLYVPSHDKCISITNQANAVGPYYTTLTTCGAAYQIAYA